MGIVDALATILLFGGTAALLISFIFSRANARAEGEADVEERLARYAGANRG